ncbi:cysteine-rich CWC family protein [Shewanella alkalitolerans]|nr:cysteine-rich CWC family protein [Shewanella alkalitolerans]
MDSMRTNASQCPLCHQPNQCAVVEGHGSDTCWCHHQTFAPKAQLSQAIAPDVCICQACAEALRLEAELGVKRVD